MKKRMNKIISLITKNKRKVVLLTIMFLMIFTSAFIYINLTNPTKINSMIASVVNKGAPANKAFDDDVFYKVVVDAYNKKNNTSLPYTTSLTDEQLSAITSISYSDSGRPSDEKIVSTKGLEKLTNLTTLSLGSNNISEVDLSKNTSLTILYLSDNNLSSIDLSNNTALKSLSLDSNNLSSIDLGNNTALTTLRLGSNNISEIDLSKNTSLTNLNLNNNNISSIDVSTYTALTSLALSYNNINSIDVSSNTALTSLYLSDNNLSSIDVSKNTSLTILNLGDNKLSSIDVSKNTALTYLFLDDNNLSSIDVSKNTALTYLDLSYNNLSSIDISNNSTLTTLNLFCNNLNSIDVSSNAALTSLGLSYNNINNIDLSKNTTLTSLYLSDNNLSSIDVSANTALTTLYLYKNNLSSIDVSTNTALTTLHLYNNPLTLGEYRLIKGTSVKGNSVGNVKLPEQFPITYETEDSGIATYEEGTIEGLRSGTTSLKATLKGIKSSSSSNSEDLVVEGTIKVFDIKSDKYEINKEDKYIYTKNDTDSSTIMKNITVENGTGKIENNVFKVMDGDVVVEEYKIIGYSSTTYDLSKGYIYVGTNVFDKTKINCINCTLEVNDNTLEIKYGNMVMESYKIVSVSSSKYDLSKDNIRIGKDETFDLDNIKVTNAAKEYSNGKLYIKYGSEVIKTYTVSSRLKGDINNDDKITIIDVSMLYRHIKKRSTITDQETLLISDINNDGKITIMDVSLLYRYVKGKINEL